MFGSGFGGGSGESEEPGFVRGGPEEILAQLRRLTEMPRPAGGYPAEWCIQAYYLGDATALAALALRSKPA